MVWVIGQQIRRLRHEKRGTKTKNLLRITLPKSTKSYSELTTIC